MSSPDPVSQPSEYRDHMLGLLGDDDPAEAQATSPSALRSVLATAGDAMRSRPEPGEWSVLELLGHLADAELIAGVRYRLMLAEDRPRIAAFDQDHWVDRLRHREADPDELLDQFEGLRRANLSLWRRGSEAERARVGIHEERGAESLDILFRMLAGHDRFHLDQMARTVAAVRAPGAGGA